MHENSFEKFWVRSFRKRYPALIRGTFLTWSWAALILMSKYGMPEIILTLGIHSCFYTTPKMGHVMETNKVTKWTRAIEST